MNGDLTGTSPDAADRLRHLLRDRSGEQRLRMACEMFDAARRLVVASLPEALAADPVERSVSLLRRFYSRDLAPAVIEEIIATLRRDHPDTEATRGSRLRALNEDERTQMRQWLENWKAAGPLLEQQRLTRLQLLSDAEAARMALDLWQFARPDAGDKGEGLRRMAQALQKLGPR